MSPGAIIESPAPSVNASVDTNGPDTVLRGQGLRVCFEDEVKALDGVDLQLHRGEHVAIVGASGSGKTTLLNCLGGDLQPDAGDMHLGGRVARVYQDYRLVGRSNARTNVLHGAAARLSWRRRIGRRRLVAEADAWLERVGLEHRRFVRVDRLSGGEQQRVAVARAVMVQPRIILADEPVSALDAGSAHALMELLRELCREQGIALLSVQHDCDLAERFADRIVLMQAGQITAATEISTAPRTAVQLTTNGTPAPSKPGDDRQAVLEVAKKACLACPEAMPKEMASASAIKPPSAWRKAARWTLALGLLLLVLGWSGWMTGLQDLEPGHVGGNTMRFLGQLVPSAHELGTIRWGPLGIALLQTLAMAVLGTAAAITWSLPLAALAARGVTPAWIRQPVRLLLNVIRSVPSILWALLCVGALGLGAVPGIIALAAYSTGYLTKFFYEAFESTDQSVSTALRTLGMSGPESFLAATWPASRLAIASSCIFMLEYNFRAASVLGIVGAGGIGYDLKLAVEWSNWHVVFVIVLALALSVCVFDAIADRIRRMLA